METLIQNSESGKMRATFTKYNNEEFSWITWLSQGTTFLSVVSKTSQAKEMYNQTRVIWLTKNIGLNICYQTVTRYFNTNDKLRS